MLGFFKIKKLRTIIIIYWFLLAYIIAALIYWFILLNQQNDILTRIKILKLTESNANVHEGSKKISIDKKRKQIQFISEGSIFLLLIITGAVFVFRAVRRQLKLSQLQHNFMIALTHELKTPIAVTKLNLETLKRRTLSFEMQQKLITNTLQEANRLSDLCSNMLLASQLEAGGYNYTYDNHNFSDVVNDCVSEYKNRFPERKFEVDLKQNIHLVSDKFLMQIAVNNIVDNAVKYSPADKPIIIILKIMEQKIILQISDNGKGIPDEEKRNVFRKFYRLGNQYTREAKGTGLGLYLSKTIATQCKGVIQIFDNIPSGSVFQLTFPNIIQQE